MQKQFRTSSGFTLVELMIAVAVTAVIAAVSSTMMGNHRQALYALDMKAEQSSIQMFLLQNLDCAATLPADVATGCPSGYLDLRSGTGNVIAAANGDDGTVVGHVAIRAKCTTSALSIESRVPTGKGAWLGWKALFPAGLEMCQGDFMTPTGGGSSTPNSSTTTTTTTTTTTGGTTTTSSGGGTSTTTSTTTAIGDDPNFELACAQWQEGKYLTCIQFDRGKCTKRASTGTVRRCARWEKRAKKLAN